MAAVNKFNGMFAFAIWDRAHRELTLVRDPYGIKPLYYARRGAKLLFASEIKALLAHPSMRAEPDLEGLLEYMTFQNFFTDRTLFKNVKLLPAGSYMTVSADTGASSITRFWDFAFTEPEQKATTEEYAEELDRLFRRAVSRNLISDVPVGSYLSGGIDSGAVTALGGKTNQESSEFHRGLRPALGVRSRIEHG